MKDWKHIPLGIPLTIASLGTLATLAGNKQLHMCFGALWTGLSLWHGWQHRKKIQMDAHVSCCPKKKPASALEQLLSTIQLRSFTEGRVRLYSPCFVNQPTLQRQVEEHLLSFRRVQQATINPATGSLLIKYQSDELHQNPKLAAIENNLRKLSAQQV